MGSRLCYQVINYLQVTITDNDLIEKSNLNRQFLFRPRHIQVRGEGEGGAIVDLIRGRERGGGAIVDLNQSQPYSSSVLPLYHVMLSTL